MKIWKSLIFLFVLLLYGCAPDAIDMYKHPIKISDLRGKWVVITYWTTWCSSCIQQIPTLNTLAKYYRDSVVVFGVNPENLPQNVLINLSQSYRVQYLFLRSFPIEKWGGKVTNLPVTFILDKKGKLYQTLHGPQTLETFKQIMNLPDVVYD